MDPVYVGWLSIIPPVIAICLAFLTKEVIGSLVVSILLGALIYSVALGGNPLTDAVFYVFQLMMNQVDIGLILVLGMLGAVIYVVMLSGGQRGIAEWTNKRFNSKTTSQLATVVVGSCLFLSDSFHSLTTGAIMRTINDSNRVSHAKMSYILDATAAPLCCLIPMGIWLAGICAVFPDTAGFSSKIEIFLANIPFNLYCIISLIMVIYFCFPNCDFGPMLKAEIKADQSGDLGALNKCPTEVGKGTIADMLFPMASLMIGSIFFILYTGGLWSSEGKTFIQVLTDSSANVSLQCGSFIALMVAFLMYVPRKIVAFKDFMNGIYTGIESMVCTITLLILAWTISGMCRLLMTGNFVADQITQCGIPVGILPAVIFIVAAALSFSTGTSWGTFGILMPIVFNICEIAAPELLLIAIASVLGGSVWGDHCSPISDTTIFAAIAADCDHMQHVVTQLPYSIIGGAVTVVGYIVAGFTRSLLATWGISLLLLAVTLGVMRRHTKKILKI